MRFSRIIAGLSLALGAVPVTAHAADEALVMAPASAWTLDYADSSCALRRAFAAGDEKALLELRQYAPGEQFEIMIVSDTLSRRTADPRIRFEPDDGWHEPSAPGVVNGDGTGGVLFSDSYRPNGLKPRRGERSPDWPQEERAARERSITGLTIDRSFGDPLTLQTGALDQPMEAMRTCVEDLVATLGLPQETPASGPQPVGLATWARKTMEAYPPEMIRARKGARVPVGLIVGKDGRPTACTANGHAEPIFLNAACASLLQHARFEPAVDAEGEPMVGAYVTTIVYETGP